MPTLEIGYEPVEAAALAHLTIGENHEILGDFVWLTWLRNTIKNPRLVVVRHRLFARFILGVWIYSPSEREPPILCELESFAGNPASIWPAGLSEPADLLNRLRPYDEVATERESLKREAAYAKRSQIEDNWAGRQDAATILKRKGLEQEAHNMRIGASPYHRSSESTKQIARDLIKAARRQ